nr:L-threonylcarbamoyladenylate synthase [Candidatus Omnitrophota bacterium]
GFRIPRNKVALELIRKAEVPIVAPSANISGKKPPTSAAQVLGELDGKIDLVIDGGRTKVGIESTVVDMTTDPPKVLREGAIKTEEIYNRLNPRSECRNTKQFRNSNFKKICQK